MLNTSDVKSLSKGGTTVSLEEISNSIDNKLSIDNLTGSNGVDIAVNGDKVEIKLTDNIILGSPQIPTEGRIASLQITTFPAGDRPYFITLDKDGIQYRYGNNSLTRINNLKIESVDMSSGGEIVKTYLNEGNVKTINNQSIYGSGNINTTPTLKPFLASLFTVAVILICTGIILPLK